MGNKFRELSDDLIYLKDVNFHDKSIKDELISFSQLSTKLGEKHEQDYKEEEKNLECEIEVNFNHFN